MKRLAVLAAVACLWGCALAGTGRVEAGFIPAIDFTSGLAFGGLGGYSAGYSFTTGNSPVVIDAVGLLSATPPNGQTVRIYVDGTTTNLITPVAIPSNAPVSSPSNGHSYSYEAITPLTLMPNTTYDIVADLFNGDGADIDPTTIVNVPDITIGAARAAFGSGLFPTGDGSGIGGSAFFGPTFEATALPEPASLTLLGLGVAGIAGYAWRRRR
jgi:hypothetical protein